MHIIIDGYNLLFAIQEDVDPIQQSREDIIAYIDALSAYLSVTLLFDSSDAQNYPSVKRCTHIHVQYSPSKLSADEYIIERLEWEKELLIITSDKQLAKEVRFLGGKTMSIHAFLTSLEKKHRRNPPKKQERESEAEFSRLLKIFEDKLRAIDDE